MDLGSLGRAVCVVGAGIRQAGAVEEFRRFVEHWAFPFVSSYGGADVLPDHWLRRGVVGTHGTQEGVDAVMEASTLIVLGCRLSVNTRGYNNEYVKGKRLVVVDVDPSEHDGREIIQMDVRKWLKTHTPS